MKHTLRERCPLDVRVRQPAVGLVASMRISSVWVLTLLVLSAGTSHAQKIPAATTSLDLTAVLENFAKSGVVRAKFKEARYISLLSEPIETEGVRYFAPPDRLVRDTTRPGRSRVVVHGGRVAFWDETGTREFDLRASDVAQALVTDIMVLLRGDRSGLQERHEISFQSEGPSWELHLTPLHEEVRLIIEWIRFAGTGTVLDSMKIQQANGDSTVTHFSEATTNLTLSREEYERIFSLDLLESGPQSP